MTEDEKIEKLEQMLAVGSRKLERLMQAKEAGPKKEESGFTGSNEYEAIKAKYSTQLNEKRVAIQDSERTLLKANIALDEFDKLIHSTENIDERSKLRIQRRDFIVAVEEAEKEHTNVLMNGKADETVKDILYNVLN